MDFHHGTSLNGKKGENGVNRQTGGGGTGAINRYESILAVSNAGNGTSYSGGTGSGGAANYMVTSEKGSDNGGKGGNAGGYKRSRN